MSDDVPIAMPVWASTEAAGLGFQPKAVPEPRPAGKKALDAQIVQTIQAYRAGAGIARGDEAVAQARLAPGIGVVQLARWVVKRRVIMFEWQAQSWLPCFQFHWPEVRLRDELGPVFAQLVPVCTAWELAHWFVQPNVALGGRLPADVARSDAGALLEAARVARDAALARTAAL